MLLCANDEFVAAAMGDGHTLAIRGRPTASVQLSPTVPAAIFVSPNPFYMRTTVTGPVSDLSVYAATGRLVRALGQTMEWDGFDSDGHRVPRGAYFFRLNSPLGPQSLRVIKLR
jgi:hypothetical protein